MYTPNDGSGPRHPEPAPTDANPAAMPGRHDQPASPVSPQPNGAWVLPRLRDRSTRDRRPPHVLADARLVAVREQARDEADARRARVVGHPDLRDALQSAGFRPEVWNGFVPPRLDAYGRRNDSIRRADLVDICAEAMRREQAA